MYVMGKKAYFPSVKSCFIVSLTPSSLGKQKHLILPQENKLLFFP